MKNPENQLNSSTPQDASTHSSNAQPTQSSADKHFKKPHMKLFNCVMKPSLSLTSLPPQSPKEASDETQSVERPYNSLKVKTIFIVKVNEFSQFFFFVFRKNAMWKRNFGDGRGNRKHQSAQQLRTQERVEAKTEMTSGLRIISLWIQI